MKIHQHNIDHTDTKEIREAHNMMRKNNIAYELHFNPDNHDVIWEPVYIDGCDSGYKISTYGDLIDKNNMPCKQWITETGYVQYSFSINGAQTKRLAHRLVAEAFIPNDDPEHKREVDHLMGNKRDNYYKALEWVTSSENKRRAVKMGLYDRKYPEHIIRQICERLELGINPVVISRELDVPVSVIYSIQHGSWKLIPSEYNIRDENGKSLYTTRTLTTDEVKEVCQKLQDGIRPIDIARSMNISINTIFGIKYRTTYKEISKNYVFDTKYRSVSDEDAHKVCQMYQAGKMPAAIHRALPHIGVDTIYTIVGNNDSYQDIRNQYDFNLVTRTRDRLLSDEQVHKICSLLEKGVPLVEISKSMNIPQEYINNIRNGVGYKDISKRYTFPDNFRTLNRKLSDETVHDICRRMQDGQSPFNIFKDIGVDMRDIYNIKHGLAYRDISKDYVFPKNFVTTSRRMSDELVRKICILLQDSVPAVEIAKQTGVPVNHVYGIKNRAMYKDISKDYVFWKRNGARV